MRKRFLATILALAMVLSITPFALAEDGGKASKPTASGTNFFANGTSITISETAPEGGTSVTFDEKEEFTATGTSAYISWDDDGTTQYVGVSNAVSVWGGADGSSRPVSVASTSITMTGGTVKNILGGNLGQKNATQDGCSSVTGNVDISITGGSVTNLIYGGGENNTCVNGTVTITLEDVKLGATCYVNGGVLGHGTEGDRNIEAGTMTTHAVVTKVIINATDSTAYVLGGGGSGSTKVKEAIVTLNGCTVANLYASGINGEMEKSSLKATDCTVTGELAATNRGFIKTADVTLEDCRISQLMTGATTGCFETDSGKPDGSGITGSIVWKIDEQTEVTTARLTPLAKRDTKDQTTATLDNITIEKSGDPLKISVDEFKPHSNASVKTFLVSESGTLTLNNVKATVESGQTLTNAGTIEMDDASKLTVASGATLRQAGTVIGKVEGAVTKCVARVGNNGYETLAEAIDAATDGQTIVLLQNIDEMSELTTDTTSGSDISLLSITKNVTIDGNGYGITITMPNDATKRSQAISVGSETVQDITVTLDDVDLTINGKNAAADKGDAIDMWATLNITNGSTVTMNGVANGFVMQGGMNAKVNVSKNSFVTADGVSGHFSNGGVWSITNSTVDIANCGTHGLSVETVKIDNSTVTVGGAKYTGLYGTKIEIVNGANVTVQNCGTSLAGTTYADKGVVQLKAVSGNEGTLTVTDSTLTLSGNGNDAEGQQSIYVGKGTLTNNGTIKADKVIYDTTSSTEFSVTVTNNGEVVAFGTTSGGQYTLPAAPTRPGYVFNGWQGSDGKIYDANETVTVSSNMTFTAQWSVYVAPNPSYLVSVNQAQGGKVTANPTAAKKGDTVTLTVTPEDGYELAELTVTDFWGKDVALTANGDGTYSFTMPASQVEIEASFTQTGEPEPELPFTDVTQADWFYDEVQYVVDNGLMIGVSDTEFAPGANLTRAMMWTILARMDGETITGANWAQDARAWAMANGVSDGTDADRAVTREELVTMIWRYVGEPAGTGDLSGFADADTVSDWAEEAMSWSVGAGLIQGDENGLTPTATAIRGQIAAILMRFCESIVK